VVNIDRMVESWVWPSEAIGRNLHYFPDLASGSPRHKKYHSFTPVVFPSGHWMVSTTSWPETGLTSLEVEGIGQIMKSLPSGLT